MVIRIGTLALPKRVRVELALEACTEFPGPPASIELGSTTTVSPVALTLSA